MPTQQEIDAQRAASGAVKNPLASDINNAQTPPKADAMKPAAVTQPSSAPVNAQGQASPVGRALTGVPTAYNPYTKGTETVNPTVGVNTQQYSPQEKAELAQSKGYTLGQDKVSISDFYRKPDGSLGFKLPDKTSTQVAGAPTSSPTPTGPVPGTNVPGATAVGAQTDALTTEQLGAQAADAAQLTAKAIQDTQKIIKDASELSKGQTIADAIKSTEQTKAAQDQINALQQQNAKMAADENIASAKAQYDSLVQTHSYLAGALGQPVSMAGLQGIDSELKRAGAHYENVVSTSRNMEEARKIGDAESMKGYTQRIADLKKQLNAEVSGSIQQALVNLGKLDQMGDLQSPEAIVKARTDILEGLNAQYSNLTTATAAKLKLLNDTQEQEYKMQQDKTAVDYNLSNKMGKMVNKFGEDVLVGGKPVVIPKDKQVHSSQMINGNMVTVFQDGTTQTTKAYDVTKFGNIDLDKTAKMGPVTGYVYDSSGNVAVSPDGKPMKYSPEAVYDIQKNSDGTTVHTSKSNPRDSYATDPLGAVIAVNGVPVPKRTEIRSDNPDVAEKAMEKSDGATGGQCTVFARKQLQATGQDAWINEGLASADDDTVEWKASKTNTSVPSVGSLVAMNTGTRFGHWGVVTGISTDPTGERRIWVKSSNLHGDEKVSTDDFLASDSQIIGYYNPNLPKKAASAAGQPGKVSEADISRLTKIVSGKTASDKEREAAGKVLAEVGGDVNEAIKKISGFNVKDKALGDEAIGAIERVGLTIADVNAPAIAANLNKGNTKAAAMNIENAAFKTDAGKQLKMSEKDADYRELYKNYSQVMGKIDNLEGKIGVISGRWSDVKKKLAGDPELQSLMSQMTGIFAKLRKSFAGSAVTETEMAALSDYIQGKTNEPIDNLREKIDNVMNMTDNEYQSARESVGLPELNEGIQIDDRSSLYFGQTGSTSNEEGVQSTRDPKAEEDIWNSL